VTANLLMTCWWMEPHVEEDTYSYRFGNCSYRVCCVLVAKGRKPTMARLTLARKIAAITLIVWKKEVRFDANYLKPQAA
jgi:hypothetical protein